jgi:predicted  nucleic acid-binding Zn-ribbon protein
MEITAIICLMCTIVGCLVGYFGFRRNQNNDIRTETKEDTRDKVQLNTKLDVLLSNNAEIKGSVKELDKKLDNFKDDVNVRLTRVEESCKQAHKRLDTFEAKGEK